MSSFRGWYLSVELEYSGIAKTLLNKLNMEGSHSYNRLGEMK